MLINFDCNAGKIPAPKVVDIYNEYISSPNINNIKTKYGQDAYKEVNKITERIKNMVNGYDVIIVNSASIANEIVQNSFNHIIVNEYSHPSIKKNNTYEWNSEWPDDVECYSTPACDSVTGNIIPYFKYFNRVKLYNNNIITHLDASQYWPYYDIDMLESNIDLLTISPHKFHGLKGIAFLIVSKNVINKIKHIKTGTMDYGKILSTDAAIDYALQYRSKMHTLYEYRNRIVEKLLNYDIITNLNKSIPWCLCIKNKNNQSTNEIIYKLSEQNILVGGGSACSSGLDSNIIRISFDINVDNEKINKLTSLLR